MADRIRSYDWSKTPLGAIENWSETLVTAINLMLFSPFSFGLFWGEEQTLLYNDHYRPFLSDKHPQALGSRGADVWAEAWETLSVPLRRAYEEGVSTGERNAYVPILVDGKLQDRWWTYGFNPIFEGDRIVGVANPGAEDTAAVLANRELRKSQDELNVGMEAAGLGMWHYDPERDIVTADERMHRIFGSVQITGSADSWLKLLHPDDVERVQTHFRGAVAGEHRYDIEYRILRNGEVRWLRSKGSAVTSEHNAAPLFAIVEDVTERKQAEAALRQNEKLAAVGRLASTIAHEINNPLEAVTNLLYLVKGSQTLDEVQEYVEIAERELWRISLIANQTLKFHKQSTKAAPSFCYDLIGDSLAMFQSRVMNNRILVEKRKRAEHPVNCFGGEIRQVLNNLIGNAIDAMPTGGRLLLRSREGTNYRTGQRGLVITVADTGAGMSLETQKRLFDAFYTTKGIGGTGLGLWISKDIVTRHHGQLTFRSRSTGEETGTVFNLFLPFESDGASRTLLAETSVEAGSGYAASDEALSL